MKIFLIITSLLLFSVNVFGQKTTTDSISHKEAFAVGELGAAASLDVKGGKPAAGYSLAIETTPIEDWLELELGVTPAFAPHLKETEIDFLIKKPWTLSSKLEFMFGVGLAWEHTSEYNVTTNAASGEAALDFMFWPFARRQFGWYLEPAYDYGFGQGHEQSVGISGGLLIAIP